MSNELLTIYDDEMNETGVAARDEVHAKGLLHQVVHCWVVSRWNGETWLYFQQRSHTKKDFPGLYDLAVGGHIDAGEEPLAAALREMREEIGVIASPEQLVYLGYTREELFLGNFHDCEIGHVYLFSHPQPVFAAGEEVEQVIRIPLSEYRKKELEGAASITACTMDGNPFLIGADEWCRHEGEFEKLILPVLEHGRETASSTTG